MKKKQLIFCIFCLIAINVSAQEKTFNFNAPSTYVPEELTNVFIGMSFKDFSSIKDIPSMESDDRFSEMKIYTEYISSSLISEVYYRFSTDYYTEDKEGFIPMLYQISIAFNYENDAMDFVKEKFGDTNSDNPTIAEMEWSFPTEQGYVMMIRKNGKGVQIISFMPDTEWEQEN